MVVRCSAREIYVSQWKLAVAIYTTMNKGLCRLRFFVSRIYVMKKIWYSIYGQQMLLMVTILMAVFIEVTALKKENRIAMTVILLHLSFPVSFSIILHLSSSVLPFPSLPYVFVLLLPHSVHLFIRLCYVQCYILVRAYGRPEGA